MNKKRVKKMRNRTEAKTRVDNRNGRERRTEEKAPAYIKKRHYTDVKSQNMEAADNRQIERR